MADGASGPERARRYGTVTVVGGGCYGSYYVRQLQRAHAAGAFSLDHLLVVDRDPACQVASSRDSAAPLQPELVVAEWERFFDDYLSEAAAAPEAAARDAIVPSPLMPHLLFDWVLGRVARATPGRDVRRVPLDTPLDVPWQRAGDDGTHYASFATWMCPINCIEPVRCPHTRGPREWTMPVALQRHAVVRTTADPAFAGAYVFHCTHRAYGVGMVDVRDVLTADAALRTRAATGPLDAIVGTVSHCHGAVSRLRVGESPGLPGSPA